MLLKPSVSLVGRVWISWPWVNELFTRLQNWSDRSCVMCDVLWVPHRPTHTHLSNFLPLPTHQPRARSCQQEPWLDHCSKSSESTRYLSHRMYIGKYWRRTGYCQGYHRLTEDPVSNMTAVMPPHALLWLRACLHSFPLLFHSGLLCHFVEEATPTPSLCPSPYLICFHSTYYHCQSVYYLFIDCLTH